MRFYMTMVVILFLLGCGSSASSPDGDVPGDTQGTQGTDAPVVDGDIVSDTMPGAIHDEISGPDGDAAAEWPPDTNDTMNAKEDVSATDVAQAVDAVLSDGADEDIATEDTTSVPLDVGGGEEDVPPCFAICGDKECGEDGCGGSCGSCEGLDSCVDGFCLITCDFEGSTYLEGEGFVAADGCSVCLCLSTGAVGCNSDDCVETCAPNCPLSKIGDGNCDLACWNEACAFDTSAGGIPDCTCAQLAMDEDCEGACAGISLATLLGDGECDDGSAGFNLNCEAFDLDGGDCVVGSPCVGDTVADCTGECWPSELIGLLLSDGVCHEFLECLQWDFDGGDCYQGPGCQEGYLPDCNDECWPWDLLGLLEGDGICHDFLECEAWDFDGGDCYQGPGCQPGTVEDCNGECWPSDFVGLFLGDQICHDFLNCPLWNYDAGDCL